MYTDLLTLRDSVVEAIEGTDLLLPCIVIPSIYRKSFRTETLPKDGSCQVTICGLGFDQLAKTRSTKSVELMIQICIESAYSDDDIADLIKLTEQLATVCSGMEGWIANRMSTDEHGMPYQFHVLREQSVYQAIFEAAFVTQQYRRLTNAE